MCLYFIVVDCRFQIRLTCTGLFINRLRSIDHGNMLSCVNILFFATLCDTFLVLLMDEYSTMIVESRFRRSSSRNFLRGDFTVVLCAYCFVFLYPTNRRVILYSFESVSSAKKIIRLNFFRELFR